MKWLKNNYSYNINISLISLLSVLLCSLILCCLWITAYSPVIMRSQTSQSASQTHAQCNESLSAFSPDRATSSNHTL